jgi:sucrose-6-phosphate hydrolase SacC (GH32 family)
LLRWIDQPVSIFPEHDYEAAGIFTGSVLVNRSAAGESLGVFAFWTGAAFLPINYALPYAIGSETVAMGKAVDGNLQTWDKQWGSNPILDGPDDRFRIGDQDTTLLNRTCVTGFRDPLVWQVRGSTGDFTSRYHMLQSGGLRLATPTDVDFCTGEFLGGAAFHYVTEDPMLQEWAYAGELLQEWPDALLGNNWECVNTIHFPEHGKSFLAFGAEPARKMAWVAGEYDPADQNFVPPPSGEPVLSGNLDFGNLYAATGFEDESGRQVLIGWSPEDRLDEVGSQWLPPLPTTSTLKALDEEIRHLVNYPLLFTHVLQYSFHF